MTDDGRSREAGEIIYHFDVDQSSIPLGQFIDTARATQEIIDDFNRSLFDSKLKYELRVKTPEHGSWIEVLGVVVTVGGSVLAFLNTEIGRAFFKGLTTEEPVVWAEKLGAAIRHKFSNSESFVEVGESDVSIEVAEAPRAALPDAEVSDEIEGEAVALVLMSFVRSDTERLKTIGVTPEKFRSAYQGRNRIFKSCIENSEVKGITFDRSSDFFIKRSEFPQRITQLPDPLPAEPIKASDLNFETVDIVVNSPNWKRDGRNWQASTIKFQDISFSIEDESFWQRVEQRDSELKPNIRDNMRVQWAYPAGASKPSHVKVYRILSYNGHQLSNPMTDQEVQALQSAVHFVESEMPDLFDERRGTNDNDDKGGE